MSYPFVLPFDGRIVSSHKIQIPVIHNNFVIELPGSHPKLGEL